MHKDSDALCAEIAAHNSGEVCLLSFSCGKDSIAAWLQLQRYFKRVVPFYCFLIPGLSFVEKSLAYYERKFGAPIIRFPHRWLYDALNDLTFQAPENCAIVERADLAHFGYEEAYRIIKEDAGLPQQTWVATGVRTVDNPLRHVAVKQNGAFNAGLRTFMPVYDWKGARVLDEIRNAGVALPIDYKIFGRSFDGIDYRFLKPLRDHFPEDFAKVKALFPLVELEFWRRHFEHGFS